LKTQLSIKKYVKSRHVEKPYGTEVIELCIIFIPYQLSNKTKNFRSAVLYNCSLGFMLKGVLNSNFRPFSFELNKK